LIQCPLNRLSQIWRLALEDIQQGPLILLGKRAMLATLPELSDNAGDEQVPPLFVVSLSSAALPPRLVDAVSRSFRAPVVPLLDHAAQQLIIDWA